MKGLGRAGFLNGTWQDYKMVVDATKEVYRLKNMEWNSEVEKMVKHQVLNFNKYECLNMLKKLNKQIEKLGGNTIGRKRKYNKVN